MPQLIVIRRNFLIQSDSIFELNPIVIFILLDTVFISASVRRWLAWKHVLYSQCCSISSKIYGAYQMPHSSENLVPYLPFTHYPLCSSSEQYSSVMDRDSRTRLSEGLIPCLQYRGIIAYLFVNPDL